MADKSKYKILVTGGAGFIGSNLVDKLLEEGHSVVVVDNLSTGNINLLSPLALFYQQDIRDYKVMDIIFETHHFDYVFHLAAQISVPESVENPKKDAEINILGTLNILSLSVKYGIKKIIFSSSGGAIYGENAPIPTTEDYCPNPISPYAISKLACEHYIKFFSKEFSLDYTILRYSNVYGPKQTPKGEAGVVAIFTENMLNNQEVTIYGTGEQIRDFVHVYDVIQANILSLDRAKNEIINISTNEATSINELFKIMKEEINYKKTPIYQQKRPGDLEVSVLSNEKAKEILNWQPSFNLKKGVKNTIEWYRTSV
ncbi:MAG: NAD-dependent epimerase/dehydratase family protein [Defluviitoga tunisiensis]|jgi:UDP-glucose 4-epimerase|uniref:UDP-glucose-4-epimerase n=1 Tax=Defluviitoga tunisiensis TaxID=1006576 RepID=A0A0C7NNR8_DEFTU|nr:NAD-dependent epimerase/dehydratase family protein [Defluviitoga tunisiensis]CEP77567.1 UDP-glucose-4-epimerase [Defluviitoga tunisiensis]HOK17013.1 NAD-dependent epimerase/dehydratase family protein [Defluviitoga tunisiensis]HOL86415.1 NAD-dependent epimerase/dehydratase family protein [Defluviitoga tunisiensis]HPP10820.1 NAD-dependent epimerase/dehydratase family protein [Defluviitoga tunisiensis]